MNKIMKNFVRAAAICAVYTCQAVDVAPMLNLNKALLSRYIVEYSTHSKQISEDLKKINERKSLYASLIEEFAPKFKEANIEYNGQILNSKRDLLDFLIAHEYVESKGDIECISSAGAIGPRQFMPDTAKEWGLENNLYVNESKNPKKSTKAALEYLLHYAKAYNHSADLALAAYNTNPKRIENVLKHNPSIKDDSDIPHGYLRAETVHYGPKIDALYIMLKNPKIYGLNIKSKEIKFEVYTTKKGDTLCRLAKKFKSDENLIAKYNGLKNKSRIPLDYSLIIPEIR